MIHSLLYPKRQKAKAVVVDMQYDRDYQMNVCNDERGAQPVVELIGIVAVKTKTKHWPTDDDERSDSLY